MNIPVIYKLVQDLEDRAFDLSVDMYHDHLAGCEPLDQTEIQLARIEDLVPALRAMLGQASHSIEDYDLDGCEGQHWGDGPFDDPIGWTEPWGSGEDL